MMPSRNRRRVIVAFSLLFSLLLLQSSSVHAVYYEDDDNDDEHDCDLDEDGETCLPPTTTHPNFVATESMDSADEHLYKKRPSPSIAAKKDEL
jgi:hypothetical protein